MFGFKTQKPLPAAPLCPEWTEADAAAWKKFLISPSGQTLLTRARAMQVSNCIRACDGAVHPKVASGITFTLNWLETMATISGESPAKDSPSETGFENAGNLEPAFST